MSFALIFSVAVNAVFAGRILEYKKLLAESMRLCDLATTELNRVVKEYAKFVEFINQKLGMNKP
jgi:hypothetical protein